MFATNFVGRFVSNRGFGGFVWSWRKFTAVKLFVKFGFVFCMALMVLAIGGCSSGSSDSSEVGVGSGEAAELEARIGVLEQQLASLPAGADGVGAAGLGYRRRRSKRT